MNLINTNNRYIFIFTEYETYFPKINTSMHSKIKTSKPHKQTCTYLLTFMAAWWGRIKIQDVINIFVTIFRGNDYDMKLHLVAKLYIPSTIIIALCSGKSFICVLAYFVIKSTLDRCFSHFYSLYMTCLWKYER